MHCFLFQDVAFIKKARADLAERLRPGTNLRFKALVTQKPDGSLFVTPPALWDAEDPMGVYVAQAKKAGYRPQFIIRLKHFNRRTA